MPSTIPSASRQGIQANMVNVEVDVASGLHSFSIVGLADKVVEESKERISSALKNTGFKPPRSFNKRVVINLAPADIKKEGGVYDLPMALGFLLDSNQININLENSLVLGELGLNGDLRPVKGVVLYTLYAKERGYKNIIVPRENKKEASLVDGVNILAPQNIKELIETLEKGAPRQKTQKNPGFKAPSEQKNNDYISENDFSLIQGQDSAKKALEIAAGGGHNVLLSGPPGSGKTLLAKASTTILPKMSQKEALEVTKIESICRKLPEKRPLIKQRPFRNPHHSSSESAIIGGGGGLNPGEISRAHKGVLFLDEFPEFNRNVLESLRQPLEDGVVTVSRAKGVVEYPAQFILIAAANPCPCGYSGDTTHECSCTTSSIIKYQRKLSGPITDRVDLHVNVPRQNYKKISIHKKDSVQQETSKNIRSRVTKARKTQEERFKKEKIDLNSEMGVSHLKKYCRVDGQLNNLLEKAVEKYKLSGRGYHSILKVARTLADLDDSSNIKTEHITLAIQYAKRGSTV